MGVTFVTGGGKDPLGPHSGPHLDCRSVLGIRPWPNKRREQPSGSSPPERKCGSHYRLRLPRVGFQRLTGRAGLYGIPGFRGQPSHDPPSRVSPCHLLEPATPPSVVPSPSASKQSPHLPEPLVGKAGRCSDHLCLTRGAPHCEPSSFGERRSH